VTYPIAGPPTPAYPSVWRDPTDVVGKRVGAFVLDLLPALLIVAGLFAFYATKRDYGSPEAAQRECTTINNNTDNGAVCLPIGTKTWVVSQSEVGGMALAVVGYWFIDSALLTGLVGYSLGKGLVGLRVIKQSDGSLAGIGRSTLRSVGWVVDAAPYCIPLLVGFIVSSTTKGHRRVGDMWARTLVVDKRDVGHPPAVPGLTMPMPAPMAWAPGGWPVTPPPPGPWQQPAPTEWQQPAPGPWQQPAPTTWQPPAQASGPSPVAPQPGVDTPLWDEARGTYIQFDPDDGRWLQWDTVAQQWVPIV